MNFQSKIGFAIVFLLIMQSFALPVLACDMSPSEISSARSVESANPDSMHEHHKMPTVSGEHEPHNSIAMSGDCCGENCQCSSATSFSSAMLNGSLVEQSLLVYQRVKSKQYRALDAHTLSQFKPPISA